MPRYASSDLVKFGLVDETTEGTLETASAVPVILTTGITPDYSTNIITDDTVSGAGEVIDAQTNLRGLNLSTPAKLRFNDCRPIIAAAMRETYATAVTVVGSSDVDMLTGGTHLDGSTGAQIRVTEGTPAAFDDLITYAGVTAVTHPNGGAESLLARITGFADSKNGWHRRIKAVWKDAGASYIDLLPGWVGGAAGFFGEPVAAETGQSATIAVGRAVRNRITGSGVVSKTGLWQFTDMVNNGKFGGGFGLVGNDLSINWSGTEGAQIEVGWIGYGSQKLSASDPTGQGFTDPNLYTPMMTAANHLDHFAIVTNSKPIVLSNFNLNGFNFTLAGGSEGIEVSGTSKRTGVRRGSHVPSGAVDYYLADDPRSEELAGLGDETSEEKGEVSFMFKDAAGNEIPVGVLWNAFGQTGPIPGAQGNTVGGTLDFSGQRLTNTSRSLVIQEIAA